jgi:hypothetical protein
MDTAYRAAAAVWVAWALALAECWCPPLGDMACRVRAGSMPAMETHLQFFYRPRPVILCDPNAGCCGILAWL